MNPVRAAESLCHDLAGLAFSPPVSHVYNPLEYAKKNHTSYLTQHGRGPKEVVFLGMNPGPWGMAQTGVPFGDPTMVRQWLGISGAVKRPAVEHPKRPVLGLECQRSEVSGTRLWGAAQKHFGQPEKFFQRFVVANYCPLCFMEDSGRNRTPDKLPAAERDPLFAACDLHLQRLVDYWKPRFVVGIGAFAAKRARVALAPTTVQVAQILHPSPASPAANRGWDRAASKQLQELGICSGC